MKNIKILLSLGITVLFINCSNMRNKDNANTNDGDKPKDYATAAEAATAAKNDMIAAMDQKVNFGVDKEKLKASNPGEAMMLVQVDMNGLLTADSMTSFEKISKNEGAVIVPLVNGNEVVAAIGLNNADNKFKVTGLGDNSISNELNMIYAMNMDMKGTITIMEVPNLNATVYEMKGANGHMYHTSYKGQNIRQSMTEVELVRILKADAMVFDKKYGEKIKKQQLVK